MRAEAAERDLADRAAAQEDLRENARKAWGESFPGDWLRLGQNEQELSSPWSDGEWVKARTEVFLAALDLHRALVTGAADTVAFNLGQLCDALSRGQDAPPPDAERAAWQTLFLLIPVISTTFASCGSMFRHLGCEELGWLLVDEAGQALPQQVAGALWRARRAVVMGDPRQLEPISQVPGEFQERLRWPFGISEGWIPAGNSAQTLADRRSARGTAVPGEDGPVWVGAPLRMHRRCEQPMFGLSNKLAYGGLMVYGTREVALPDGYPPSGWCDLAGAGDGGKWVPAQGRYLVKILRQSRAAYGVELDPIYVISPFRDVVRGCRALVRDELRLDGVPGQQLEEFVDGHIGTVHTMQGREADIVVLMLGTDPSRAKKARDWAGHPVNLLNVAVSRARRRLLVIGDYADWQDAPNFGVFAPGMFAHWTVKEPG